MPDIDDATLEARTALATEVILTSGTIQAEDITRGWYDRPDPSDEMQRAVVLLALTIICGGLDGAHVDDILSAWNDKRLLTAATRALLDAVDTIRCDGDSHQLGGE